MTTIWKFPLSGRVSRLEMPRGSRVLTVQMQGDVPTLWALCEPEAATETRSFAIAGTGWERTNFGEYVATVQDRDLVWHIFETTRL